MAGAALVVGLVVYGVYKASKSPDTASFSRLLQKKDQPAWSMDFNSPARPVLSMDQGSRPMDAASIDTGMFLKFSF